MLASAHISHTQENFQGADIAVADASSKRVYVPEEPGEIHAHEAAGCHQEGGESHQVLARGHYTRVGRFQGQNCIKSK